MIKLKFLIFILSYFFGCVALSAQNDFSYVFQHDTYMTKNDCEDFKLSFAKAFQIRVVVSPRVAKKNLLIQFRESKTGFSQKIIYDTKTFFYPGVFTAQGHHEYGMPECDLKSGDCEFSVFIFLTGDILNQPKWNIEVSISEPKSTETVFSGSLNEIDNQFFRSEEKFLTGLDFKTSSETLRIAFVDPKKVAGLIKEGFDVKFIFSWRQTLNQVEYTEEFHPITADDAWFKKKSFEFIMDQKILDPVYLSFMVLAQKQTTSYESKIVIVDKKNEFFKQCKK